MILSKLCEIAPIPHPVPTSMSQSPVLILYSVFSVEYIAVEKVEGVFKQSPVVDQLWVYGNRYGTTGREFEGQSLGHDILEDERMYWNRASFTHCRYSSHSYTAFPIGHVSPPSPGSMESMLVAVVVPSEAHARQWAEEKSVADSSIKVGVRRDQGWCEGGFACLQAQHTAIHSPPSTYRRHMSSLIPSQELCGNAAFRKYVLEQLRATGKAAKLRGFEDIKALHLESDQVDLCVTFI